MFNGIKNFLSGVKEWFSNLFHGRFSFGPAGNSWEELHDRQNVMVNQAQANNELTASPYSGNQTVNDLYANYNAVGGSAFNSLVNKYAEAGITGQQAALNEMQLDNQRRQYAFQVQGMQEAGLNPALMYESGAQSAPSAPAPTQGASILDLIKLFTAKKQIDIAEKDAESRRIGALADKSNAQTNARLAGVGEMNAETSRMRQEVDAFVAKHQISLLDEQKDNLAASTAKLKVETDQLPARLQIAERQVAASEKQAVASLKSAMAAATNAAINKGLSEFQAEVLKAQAYITWANGDGQSIVNKYLDEKQRGEIKSLDEKIRLQHKQGNLVDAQMVKTYVNVGTDISGAVNQWLNPFSKGPGQSSSANFDLSGAYQGVAYGYD